MKHSVRNEMTLIENLQGASQRSLEEIYANYCDFVYKCIYQIIRSEGDAQEIANDIFIKVWHNRAKIDSSRPMKNYLLLLAQRESYNYLNSKHAVKLNANVRMDDSLPELAEFIDLADSETSLYAKELAMTVRLAVDRMPTQRRAIFEQSRYEGLSNKEIALNMGLSIKTVETHISAAIKDLKKIILVFCLLYTSALSLRVTHKKEVFTNERSMNFIHRFETGQGINHVIYVKNMLNQRCN